MLQDNPQHVDNDMLLQQLHAEAAADPIEWAVVWKVTRPLLLVWAISVWFLLLVIPAISQVTDWETAFTHLPYPAIGLAFVGAMTIAFKEGWTGKMLVFLAALLMLAGWI